MDYMAIVLAIAAVGGVGVIMGCLLGIAEKKFKVETDERESAVRELLPGSNCGGCGYAGCDALAAAIVKGEASVDGCPGTNSENIAKIAAIMGVASVEDKIRKTAYVKCTGDCEKSGKRFDYHGVKSCIAAVHTAGGDKACTYGCLGYGECVSACRFDAVTVVNGAAIVNPEKCTACGQCVRACPRNIIELIPYSAKYMVGCSSHDKGKDTKAVCSAGCIGCRLCERNCPEHAITVTDNNASIDYDKCTGCGACAGKCPVKVIMMHNV